MEYIPNPLQKKLLQESREKQISKTRAKFHAKALKKAAAIEEYYDAQIQSERMFHIGDIVLMYASKLVGTHSRKTIPSLTGPYYIIKELP